MADGGTARGHRGPLADSYPGAVALVVCSLTPYLALTAAVLPLGDSIGRSLDLAPGTLDLAVALSAGAYSAGTVLAVQFAVHLPARRMLLVYEAALVAASVLAAAAPDGAVFVGAFIAQGLCTSLLLVAAVPPLVTGWPAGRMPGTGAIMNLCIFGAVAVGPSVGALQLAGGGWRPLFWGVAAVATLALVFAFLTFEDDPPRDRGAPWDPVAVLLAVAGCGAAFFGAGELQATMSAGLTSLAPLVGGTAMVVALVVYQYRARDPLMPVRATATTVPVTGIFIALTASAAAFGIMVLVLEVLHRSGAPLGTALYFLPEFVAAVAVAGLFGVLFPTRFTPLLALGGMAVVVGAAVLLLGALPRPGPVVAAVSALLGLGVGASVSPALFMAGFSLPSGLLQRVFALIELMRGVTAFLVAPILVFLAGVVARTPAAGIRVAVGICLAIAAVGLVGGSALYLTGRPRLVAPDLERWQGGSGEPAWESPPLMDALRPRATGQAAEAGAPGAECRAG